MKLAVYIIGSISIDPEMKAQIEMQTGHTITQTIDIPNQLNEAVTMQQKTF